MADSIPLAAQNAGGLAGMGVGVGMGNMMGQQLGGVMGQMGQTTFPAGTASAAPAVPVKTIKEELTGLKDLFDSQLISQQEFDTQRAAIIKITGWE